MNLGNLLEMQGMLIVLMLLGLILTKKGLINPGGKATLTELVINVTLPCSILKSFMMELDMGVIRNSVICLVAALLAQLLSWGVSHLLFRGYEDDRKKILQYDTICTNAGYLGNPIAEGAFGPLGLVYASFYLIPQRIFMWSVGLTYFTESPSRKALVKKVATHPCILAAVLGVVLMLTQIQLPGVLNAAVKALGSANTSMSMLLIGAILASVDLRTIVDKHTLYFSFVRLILMPGLVFLGCMAARLDPIVAGVSILMVAMPAASTSAVLAAKYHKDEAFAAKIVALTTILSMLTAPLWCMLVV